MDLDKKSRTMNRKAAVQSHMALFRETHQSTPTMYMTNGATETMNSTSTKDGTVARGPSAFGFRSINNNYIDSKKIPQSKVAQKSLIQSLEVSMSSSHMDSTVMSVRQQSRGRLQSANALKGTYLWQI